MIEEIDTINCPSLKSVIVLPFFMVNDNKYTSISEQLKYSPYYLLRLENFERKLDNIEYSTLSNENGQVTIEQLITGQYERLVSMTSTISVSTQIKQKSQLNSSIDNLEIKFGSSLSINIIKSLTGTGTERNIWIESIKKSHTFPVSPNTEFSIYKHGKEFLLYRKDENKSFDSWSFEEPGLRTENIELNSKK